MEQEFMPKKRKSKKSKNGNLSISPFFHIGPGEAEDKFAWKKVSCAIQDTSGKTFFSLKNVEAPEAWSQTAVEIAAAKYFRPGVETSIKQLVSRVSETIGQAGLAGGYFSSRGQMRSVGGEAATCRIFEQELKMLLYSQRASFNSPVWFNCGLWQKYKIDSGGLRYAWDEKRQKVVELNKVFARPQGSACFIQSVEDNLESIFQLVMNEARIFKYGSGSGTNFSNLRSKYERLSGGGLSSGVLSFLDVYDRAAASIKSGGTTRRAAKMVILDIDHPEISEFIKWKAHEEAKAKALIRAGFEGGLDGEAYRTVSGQNGNNSVRVTDAFMEAVEREEMWSLLDRLHGQPVREVPARKLWREIAEAAWACADPGIQFHDRINEWHTCSRSGPIRASNPCSEYMFLDNSACNLASLNLRKFLLADGQFDFAGFVRASQIIFLAQEILVDFASYPTAAIARNSHDFRPLGLGLAGLGSFLMEKNIPYHSDRARQWGAALAALMTGVAYQLSGQIAEQRGPFAAWRANKRPMLAVMKKHREALQQIDFGSLMEIPADQVQAIWDQVVDYGSSGGFRNAQATAVAPTGTIGLVMDSETTGIEPEYALVRVKNLVGGGVLELVSRSLELGLRNLARGVCGGADGAASGGGASEATDLGGAAHADYSTDRIGKIMDWVKIHGTVAGCDMIDPQHRDIFATALEIPPEGHLKMMAAVQPFISGAISKTVNLDEKTTVEEIEALHRTAWRSGLKSIAIYRHLSKG
ncbi:MAG: adenosylcobalamin-dependent ribonucleoside-diphosphate reductase, partial [Bdellovibrio sp.]